MLLWLILVFVVGACIGSFLNVCAYRLPLEKSLLWPSSRCGQCLQPIAWYDNIPLLSYWLLRGQCRTCGTRFSIRYFLVELGTALIFVGLFQLVVIDNVHGYELRVLGAERYDRAVLITFVHHVLLTCFLLVASLTDLDEGIIPASLTVTGALAGIVFALLFPWPWPYLPGELVLPRGPWWLAMGQIPEGLYVWPVWGPLPAWLPAGSWWSGLAAGLAGILAGTMLLRVIRFLFGIGMGPEHHDELPPDFAEHGLIVRGWLRFSRIGGKTLGLGDADLMMMAGAFLGWQAVLVAFFVGVFPGLFFALPQLFLRGNRVIPFGPALAIGVVITFLGWSRLGPAAQGLFFNGPLLAILAGVGAVLMVISGFVIRYIRRFRI